MKTNLPKDTSRARRSLQVAAYWLNLILQPLLAVGFVLVIAWLFGYLQRTRGWFNNASSSSVTSEENNAQYACSMLCVFVGAPGRCPVCGMELQEIETTGDPKDIYGLTIDPTSRRLANIKTTTAMPQTINRSIEVLGRIEWDETRVATIAAYTKGRIEKLLVNYTGALIQKGDPLAILYSPDLYSDQVGLLQAKNATEKPSTNSRLLESNRRLYESARRRLLELGLTEAQINKLEDSGKAQQRVEIFSPAAGTVVEKMVESGQYVDRSMALLKIADLSTVWLMLELYPEDAANIALGQTTLVQLQTQASKTFEGKVSFIDPEVTPETRTVRVRVAIPNEAGLIKVGELATAKLQITKLQTEVVVPRTAVLRNGLESVAYVETEPGRFEFRTVQVAETLDDQVVISAGIEAGEQVVASGTFMLDSTFNIQGKASLIDPQRATPLQRELPLLESPTEDLPQMELPTLDLPEEEKSRTQSSAQELPEMELPEMELPEMELPEMELPEMELPEMELPQ